MLSILGDLNGRYTISLLPLLLLLLCLIFGAHHENLIEDGLTLSVAKTYRSPVTLHSIFWQHKVYVDICRGSLERGVKRQ